MLGLPKTTELNRQLPKKQIYAKFNMNTVAKERFDADISKITIVNEISPQTIKTLTATDEVKSFFILHILLKRKDYKEQTIIQISKLINQNMLLVLECDGECRLAIYRTKLIQSEWKKTSECNVTLKGLDLGAVWQNVITQVGDITIEEGNSLDEQIEQNAQREKIIAEIERLEAQARRENQPKKKFEIVKIIKQKKLEIHYDELDNISK